MGKFNSCRKNRKKESYGCIFNCQQDRKEIAVCYCYQRVNGKLADFRRGYTDQAKLERLLPRNSQNKTIVQKCVEARLPGEEYIECELFPPNKPIKKYECTKFWVNETGSIMYFGDRFEDVPFEHFFLLKNQKEGKPAHDNDTEPSTSTRLSPTNSKNSQEATTISNLQNKTQTTTSTTLSPTSSNDFQGATTIKNLPSITTESPRITQFPTSESIKTVPGNDSFNLFGLEKFALFAYIWVSF